MVPSINKSKNLLLLSLACMVALQACNKEFDYVDPTPPTTTKPGPTGTVTIAELINTDTSYSILKAAVAKAGLNGVLGNAAGRYTLFAPDNAAFRRSGIPSDAVIAALPVATVTSIVSYHLTPEYVPAESIPTVFPNLQYPTFLNPAPQLSALLRLTIFPSRRDAGAWVNNIPILTPNVAASNGVMHKVLALVAPPSKSAYELITADTTLTFLVAALERADSGRTSIADGSLIEASKSIGANLTLFAPTNDAFRALLISMGLPPSSVVFAALPVTLVRGLAAYHLLPTRAFSVNMPTTATLVKTLLNSAVPTHPGISVMVQFSGPFVANFTVTGAANGGASATVLTQDIHATNGVIHKINRVLLPQ